MVNPADKMMFKKFILDNTDGDILDCGCGEGELLKSLWYFKPGKLVGIDISPEKVNKALEQLTEDQVQDERIDYEIMDIEDLAYDDGVFDTAIMTDTLQYITRPQRALAEISRVLRANGRLIVALTALHTKESIYGRFDVAKVPELIGERFEIHSIEERGGLIRLVATKKSGTVRRVLELRPKGHRQVPISPR